MPIELSDVGDSSPFMVISGEVDLGKLDLSADRRKGALVGMAGVVTVPLARVTVLTWLSSLLALLSIVAPASDDEKRAGKWGRRRGELEKKRGDGGSSGRRKEGEKEKRSSVYFGRGSKRRLFCKGSDDGVARKAASCVSSPAPRFFPVGGLLAGVTARAVVVLAGVAVIDVVVVPAAAAAVGGFVGVTVALYRD